MHNYMCNKKTEMETTVYIQEMCIFIHKEENENCRKNTISAKRLFIYYNKKILMKNSKQH